MRNLTAAMLCAASVSVVGISARAAAAEPNATDTKPKNVIVMIADGAGYTLLDVTRYWTGEPLVVDNESWQALAMSTYSLRGAKDPGELGPDEQNADFVYNPQLHFDTTPVEGSFDLTMFGEVRTYPRGFAGYEWHRKTYPDSSTTMSALMTGQRSYNGSVNFSGDMKPLLSVAELADRAGKRVGAITSVPISHATPASGAGAHNEFRGNYKELTHEMLMSGIADVLGGGGHPYFDDDAQPRQEPVYAYFTPEDWAELVEGRATDANGEVWTMVTGRDDILDLADGPTPRKLLMIPEVGRTLQQKRSGIDRNGDGVADEIDAKWTKPGEDAYLRGIPSLPEMTRAALNALDNNPEGFFLVIEGGATDWAAHDNEMGRFIEEYVDFDDAIAEVTRYLDAGTNGNTWKNTLVIVTADHDHLVFGPESDTIPFQPIVDNGPGRMPGYLWLFNSHSNIPVPLFFRGAGAADITPLATKIDAYADGRYSFGHGPYLHQADLGQLLMRFMGASEDELPTTSPAPTTQSASTRPAATQPAE